MSSNHLRVSFRWTILLLVLSTTAAAGPSVQPKDPGPKDRCAVCGMMVAPHAAWIAQVQFASGAAAYFDGSKCLFRYLLSRDQFAPELRKETISATFVTSYYDLQRIPLDSAFFVTGSDVTGPMGPELVPLRSRAEADEFLADHSGQLIVRAPDVTADLLASLKK